MAKRHAVPANGSRAPSSNAAFWIEGLLCGVFAAMVPTVALLFAVLLGPALGALAFDRQQGKPIARSVLLCSLAASIQPVRTLWGAGNGLGASMALVSDLNVVGTAWAAAAAGWLLAELAPFAARAALEAAALSHAAKLRAARARLVEDWGMEPAPQESAPAVLRPAP